jgi:hypothetical protein
MYDTASGPLEPIEDIDDAYIAFPDDYAAGNSIRNNVFVGLHSSSSSGVNDIYHISGAIRTLYADEVQAQSLGYYDIDSADLSHIAYFGSSAEGILAAADISGKIFFMGEACESDPYWDEAEKPLSGINPHIHFNNDGKLYAATANYDDGSCFGSVFGYSNDCNVFTGLSLISFKDLSKLEYSGIEEAGLYEKYLVVSDGANEDIFALMKSKDGGESYFEIYNSMLDKTGRLLAGQAVYVSHDYNSDRTIYLVCKNKHIYRSTDGGDTFNCVKVYVPDGEIIDFSVIDSSNFYVGGTDGIYKNNYRFPSIEVEDLGEDYDIRSIEDDWFVIEDKTDGEIYLSTDAGLTFDIFTELNSGMKLQYIDRDNRIVYAVDGSGIYRFRQEKSYKWEKISDSVWKDLYITVKNLEVSEQGVVYITAVKVGGESPHENKNNPQAFRRISLPDEVSEEIEFEAVEGSSYKALSGELDSGSFIEPIYAIRDPSNSEAERVRYTLKSWTDGMEKGPELSEPLEGENTYDSVILSWNAPDKAEGYIYQVAANPEFEDAVTNIYPISGTTAAVGDLKAGATYYWRVKVASGKPLESPWSEVRTFTVKLGQANTKLQILSPQAGDAGVHLNPAFQWTGVAGASEYEIQIADNANFDDIISALVNTTAWVSDTTLEYGTTYYWRVRALNSNAGSDWVTGVFTTREMPGETASENQQWFDPKSGLYFETEEDLIKYQAAHQEDLGDAVSTPAYIWVIIAVGGMLVIIMVVLIFKARSL